MSFTYSWTDAEQKCLKREDSDGHVLFIPHNVENRHYVEFLESGATAAPYVAPPEPEPLTPEQKLANAGLTVDELKTLLEI